MTALSDRLLAQRFADLARRLEAAGRLRSADQAEREDIACFVAALLGRSGADGGVPANHNQPSPDRPRPKPFTAAGGRRRRAA